jgi:dTDP-4-amino-4,6-dideoxygalactose transaminase
MTPLHDVAEQNASIREGLDNAISRVLNSGTFVGGSEVKQLEKSFSEYIGIGHCIGVGNATDGFEIAFKALDLPPSSEVIIPANAHVSPALAALNAGLKPIFCDVDSDRLLLSKQTIEAQITSKTKAVVAVHLYGRVCPMDEILQLCKEHDLILIEDFSQAQGASFNGRKVGAFGTINVCSFYPTKPFGGLGDGGAITTNDNSLAEKCRNLAQYGWTIRDNTRLQGQNSRLDAIQAAVLNVKLPHLDKWNADRISKAESLIDELMSADRITTEELQEGDICHLLPVRSGSRDVLIQKLENAGFGYGIHYPIPLHQQELFAFGQSLPDSERCCNEVLSIPLDDGIIEVLK